MPNEKEIKRAAEWIVDSIATATQLDIANPEHGIRENAIANARVGIQMLLDRRFFPTDRS